MRSLAAEVPIEGSRKTGRRYLLARRFYHLKSRYLHQARLASRLARHERAGTERVSADENHGSGIRWKTAGRVDLLSSCYVRAARAMLRLSQAELAELAKVDRQALTRLEAEKLKRTPEVMLGKLLTAFEQRGIEFTPEGKNHGAGLRWRLQTPGNSRATFIISPAALAFS